MINGYDDNDNTKNTHNIWINSRNYSDMITVNVVKSMKFIKNQINNML